MTACVIEGCSRPRKYFTGWCLAHYQRAKRGQPMVAIPPRLTTVEDRFWSKVEKTSSCWHWRGALRPNGYGTFAYSGVRTSPDLRGAHRVAFELSRGPIPEGLHIDHLCRNRACVNPEHLEAVTQAENNRREGIDRRSRRDLADLPRLKDILLA